LQSVVFGVNFNQPIDKLPQSVKELGFWSHCNIKNNIPQFIKNIKIIFYHDDKYNEPIDNIPYHIEKITINDKTKAHYLKKIPWGCKVFDEKGEEIMFN
jgi:hypothetical protein